MRKLFLLTIPAFLIAFTSCSKDPAQVRQQALKDVEAVVLKAKEACKTVEDLPAGKDKDEALKRCAYVNVAASIVKPVEVEKK